MLTEFEEPKVERVAVPYGWEPVGGPKSFLTVKTGFLVSHFACVADKPQTR